MKTILALIISFILSLQLFAYTPTDDEQILIDTFFEQIKNFERFAPSKYAEMEQRVRLIDVTQHKTDVVHYVIARLYDVFGITEEIEQQAATETYHRAFPETLIVQNLGVIRDDIIQISYLDELYEVNLLGIEPTSRISGPYQTCVREDTAERLRRFILTGGDLIVNFDPLVDQIDTDGVLQAYVSRAGNELGLQLIREGFAIVSNEEFTNKPQYEEVFRHVFDNEEGVWEERDCRNIYEL